MLMTCYWFVPTLFLLLLVLQSKATSVVTLLTGTHTPLIASKLAPLEQSPLCRELNENLRRWTVAFSKSNTYHKYRNLTFHALSKIGKKGDERCTIGSTGAHYTHTFPFVTGPMSSCSSSVKRILDNKKYWLGPTSVESRSRIVVPWFFFRTDLVNLDAFAFANQVKLRYLVTVSPHVDNAAFYTDPCNRFNAIMQDSETYKQRFLMVLLADLSYQLDRIKHAQVVKNLCDSESVKFECMPSNSTLSNASITAIPFFTNAKLAKTIFAKDHKVPTIVLVAGLEGTGHHLFSLMAHGYTTAEMYIALNDYIAISAWNNTSREATVASRQRLVDVLSDLKKEEPRVYFLNTVKTNGGPVNMFSIPWGGPHCHCKKFARNVCTLDVFDLASIGEEAGVDFRIVVTQRSLKAAIVSSSINRDFGTVMSQSRLIGQANSLLETSLTTIDPAFYHRVNYEDFIKYDPEQSPVYTSMLDFLNIPRESPLAKQIYSVLAKSNSKYGLRDQNDWTRKVDPAQFTLMSDFLFEPVTSKALEQFIGARKKTVETLVQIEKLLIGQELFESDD